MRSIDLNGDLGEGAPHDEALLRLLTSASIACGGHAGDAASMERAVRQARAAGVAIGAHPGYPDRAGFGRMETGATPAEIADLVRVQVGELQAIARALGARVTHVKPHGALYHRAARDAAAARALAEAVAAGERDLVLFGPAGTELERAGRAAGLKVCREAFADRRYRADGQLVSRTKPGALIIDPAEAARQAVAIATGRSVTTLDGRLIVVEAETICVHGDGAQAVALLEAVRSALIRERIELRSYH